MTESEFEDTVRKLRAAQSAYFRTRNSADLNAAKGLEKCVDEELKRREPEKKGKSLFDMIEEFDEPITERQKS